MSIELIYSGNLSGVLPGIEQLQAGIRSFATAQLPIVQGQIAANISAAAHLKANVAVSGAFLKLAIAQLEFGIPHVALNVALDANVKALAALRLQLSELQAALDLVFDLSPSLNLLLYTGALRDMTGADYAGVLSGHVPGTSTVVAPILVIDTPQAHAAVRAIMPLPPAPAFT